MISDEPLPPLHAALEAILFVVDEPVDEGTLAQVLECPRDEVVAVLQRLQAEYAAADRGFELRQVGAGWRLYSSPSCAAYVERFVRDAQPARLSQAALETLAVIAYRQPTTRARIAAVRGVNVDAVVRTLLARGLVTEAGVERETGAILYTTTDHFLERLGLTSLEELPPLSEHLPDPSVLDDDVTIG
ncbi:MAG TPA: SMC-Scp complex subunit ScpB [Mycobacteriales bacterium]|nr:SMC-Scp complex subunit ScpB [Mycobacteriales bacterium]